ncbi:ATP-binding protein [Marivirga arenosa]|uniref:histidine kinase n=1 Tax=Marivirga arenosa TaxID=3059076 RepID=A0AA51RBC7_9BACT|nr:ATP-binding protein [Marivirga sp. ABR2-2]WMN07823.1 ATP-binding protein [Marivirga sp. ABR2-2]
MIINILLIRQNGKTIQKNQDILNTSQEIIINAEEIVEILHLIDVGIRGYYISGNKFMYKSPADSAKRRIEKTFNFLDQELDNQFYALEEYSMVKDTVNYYFKLVSEIDQALENGNKEKAKNIILQDQGYPVWLIANSFSNKLKEYELNIQKKATYNFQRAVNTSFWLQIILFIIALPTLLYAARYAVQSLGLSEKLRVVESEKSNILKEQKEKLERLVRKRTDEILAQNEEIRAQNEEISSQNDVILSQNEEMKDSQRLIEEKNEELTLQNDILNKAKITIEKQQKLLELKNEELTEEVAKQNKNLKETNLELINQINKLQQFGYIVSHNLRSSTARLLGLSNLIDNTSGSERENIIELMKQSSEDLHELINDVSMILLIQKPITKILEEVDIRETISKVKNILKNEIDNTSAVINESYQNKNKLKSLPLYIESIIYNLISNAIKYRQKNLNPQIYIKVNDFQNKLKIEIEDNGLGIDLENNIDKVFGLYKRFHFHVEGKGLGLYLVKTQIDALGGKIEVESKIGRGTKFTIII